MPWPFSKKPSPPPEESRSIHFESLGQLTAGAILDVLTKDPVNVTVKKALGVPAVWAAVNFISNTVSTLPFQLFQRTSDDGREILKSDTLYGILHDAPNPEWTSADLWKYTIWQALTGGRGMLYIERAGNRRVLNLWPLDPRRTEVLKVGVRRVYRYRQDDGSVQDYDATEVIDITFAMDVDQVHVLGPIASNRDGIALNIALQEYAQKLFLNGGVPPLSLEGPFQSPGAVQRAAEDITRAIKQAAEQGRQVLPIPTGHALKALGINPEQGQFVQARLLAIQEVARIYGIPPNFLQDLSHGTFANTEQQDLQVVKHTLGHWVTRVEKQVNLKLFGRPPRARYAEFNVDGLLRGDFKTRMEGITRAIQNALITPNEGRGLLNREPLAGGDDLMIQQNMTNVVRMTNPAPKGQTPPPAPGAAPDDDQEEPEPGE